MADAATASSGLSDEDLEISPDEPEPGASREKMLLMTDSYEEIEEETHHESWQRRGTISEIDGSINCDPSNGSGEWKTNGIEQSIGELQIEATDDVLDEDDDVTGLEWKSRKKHVFVLSESGKPIYSRYGNEDKLVTLIGVMQAIVSFVQLGGDHIRCIVAGKHRFVFNVRGPLILVTVSQGSESVPQIVMQLSYVHNQIVSVLTQAQLARIFEQRRNFDLRRLLTGSEKFVDNLLNFMEYDPCFILGAVRCLSLTSSVRDTITQSIIQSCSKVKNLVFAILVAKEELITLVRMKKYYLHPGDLHLILNMVCASESFKNGESWMPLCLPKFDSSGFLHAHVSYLEEDSPACLMLLTVDRDMFFTLSECKRKIVEKLQKTNCLHSIKCAAESMGYSINQLGVPDLRHFIYKAKSTAQYTSPCYGVPYITVEEQQRLFDLYMYIHHRIHCVARPLKILYYNGQKESIMGWVTQGFELYVVFEPLVTKASAVDAVNKLLRWIKKEEDHLFILNSPTF